MQQDSQATIEQLYEDLGFSASENFVTTENVSLNNYPQKIIFESARSKLGVDSVFFYKSPGSDTSVPYIYFSRLEGYNPAEVAKQLADLHKLAWNMGRAPVLFVALPAGQVLIYDTYHPPTDVLPNQKYETGLIDNLNIFSEIEKERRKLSEYHRQEFESGRFWLQHRQRFDPKNRADQTLLSNLKVMRQEILSSFLKDGVPLAEASEITHTLLGRSIFIKYLEDRRDSSGKNVFPDTFFEGFYSGATRFTDVLVNVQAAIKLFDFLNEKFNGDLFPVEKAERKYLTKKQLDGLKLFLTGEAELSSGQLGLWKFYSFEVIPIEFISSIYEEFFYIRQKEQSGEKPTKSGTHYTPHYLVEFLVDEVFPWLGIGTDFKALDPACGSGIFLVEIYRRLIAHWHQANPNQQITHTHLEKLLTENIFGVDSNTEAIRVAAFSLYLTFCDFLEPRHIWKHVKFPSLKCQNLFPIDFFEEDVSFEQNYDLVIGNPPWQSELTPAAEKYRTKVAEDFPARQVAPDNQIALAFLWRSAELCQSDGEVCLLLPSKGLLFNRSGTHRDFRQAFFSSFHIKTIINFSASRHILFEKAVGPGAAIFFSPHPPNDSEPILYCSPKPTHSIEDKWQITIEPQDINLLPRTEALQNDIIWKVAMWGGPRDYELIKKLMAPPYQSLAQVCDEKGWIHGEGMIIGNPKRRKTDTSWLLGKPFVASQNIKRFVADETKYPLFDIQKVYGAAKTKKGIFQGPHILVKQSPVAGEIGFRATLFKNDVVFKDAFVGINNPQGDINLLAPYCVALNSRVPLYFSLMTSRRWLVERDELNKEEVMSFPLPVNLFDEAVTYDDLQQLSDDSNWEIRVGDLIEKLYNLSEDELILINDAINYTLDYFRRKQKSPAANPTYDKSEGERILIEYVNLAQKTLQNSFGQQFTPTIFQSKATSLRVVALKLSDVTVNQNIIIEESQQALDQALNNINDYLQEQRSPNLFIQRNMRTYIGKTIYIIKPDQRRYWTKSMALRDADEIYIDVMEAWSS